MTNATIWRLRRHIAVDNHPGSAFLRTKLQISSNSRTSMGVAGSSMSLKSGRADGGRARRSRQRPPGAPHRVWFLEVDQHLSPHHQIHPWRNPCSHSCWQTSQLFHRLASGRGRKGTHACEKDASIQKRSQVRPLCPHGTTLDTSRGCQELIRKPAGMW